MTDEEYTQPFWSSIVKRIAAAIILAAGLWLLYSLFLWLI